MKVLLKNIALFVILAFTFSALVACNGGTDTSSIETPNVPANTADASKADKPKSDYPPAPSAIMQADIKLLDDTTFKLEDKKGKVILANLWATWCGPCIEEMPHLVEMHEKYKDKNFEVLGLNTDDEPKEMIERFAAKQKLNYPLAWADGKLTTEFVKVTRLQGIPQTLLINRDGQLRGMFTGGGPKTIAKMKETVEKAINE